jgi:crotonobetainyl-CoA:carnitine CoA-transferase CaiB-like acyl-CoA transferase
LGPELQKYLDEIANYRNFLRFCDELVQVNEEVCDLRSVPEVKGEQEREELKKKLQRRFRKKYRGKWIGL